MEKILIKLLNWKHPHELTRCLVYAFKNVLTLNTKLGQNDFMILDFTTVKCLTELVSETTDTIRKFFQNKGFSSKHFVEKPGHLPIVNNKYIPQTYEPI